jgi:protein-S-isoprenylcysteine O-methyltransferase Ste14
VAGAIAPGFGRRAGRRLGRARGRRPLRFRGAHVPKGEYPVPGNRPTTTIVRSGPYGFSRNPIYLAFTLFQLGLAAWVNSLGLLLTLFPALALMALVVIPREERNLETRFPSEYPPYKRAVRRWL